MTEGPLSAPSGRARRAPRAVLTLALLPGLLAGCASGGSAPAPAPEPEPATVDLFAVRAGSDADNFTNQLTSVRDTILAEPRERVWGALPYVFRTLGVETSTIDGRSHLIGNASWRPTALHGTRLSSFIECGRGIVGPNADHYDITMQLLVQLEPRGASSTLMRVAMDAYARPRAAAGAAIHCATSGTLEGRMVRLLAEGIARGEGTVAAAPSLAAGESMARLPSAGDFIRVGCAPTVGAESSMVEGAFMGVSGGSLQLDAVGGSVRMPATGVASLQIRERRSRARIGAVTLALVGGAAGAHVGRQQYDPDGNLHYKPGVFTTIGAVVGGVAGALLGALGGSLMDYDVWVDATPSWQARFGGGAPSAAFAPDGDACWSLQPDG